MRIDASSIRTLQPTPPSLVLDQLKSVGTELERLDAKLEREIRAGFYVSREWSPEVASVGDAMSRIGYALKQSGGAVEASVGADLYGRSATVMLAAGSLAALNQMHARFTPKNAGLADLFDAPIAAVRDAVELLTNAPARP